jgi:NitT/TauT family transport system substrate-binding protein
MIDDPTIPVYSRSAALSLIAGGLLAAASPAAAQTTLPVVRIGAQAIDATGEAFYGADAGIYVANGVTPQVTLLSNGATVLNGVLAGDLDVGEANPMTIAAAMARGIPIQVIAPAVLYSRKDANANLVVAKDSPFKRPKDLIGATFGVGSLNDFNHISLLAWLDINGISREAVKFVELPFGQVGGALQRGLVQASFITEPVKSDAVRAGQIRDFADTYLAVGPEIAVVVWFATKAWLQKNPETVKKFVNGIYATAKWANTHTAESAPMLAKAAKMDPAVVAQMKRLYFATSNERRYLEPILNVAAKYGALQRPIPFEEYCAFPAS